MPTFVCLSQPPTVCKFQELNYAVTIENTNDNSVWTIRPSVYFTDDKGLLKIRVDQDLQANTAYLVNVTATEQTTGGTYFYPANVSKLQNIASVVFQAWRCYYKLSVVL